MLSNCDDIIRQHKAACLRVTSLLACKDLVWVGTSAGVLLTISATQTNMAHAVSPIVTGTFFINNLIFKKMIFFCLLCVYRNTLWTYWPCAIFDMR